MYESVKQFIIFFTKVRLVETAQGKITEGDWHSTLICFVHFTAINTDRYEVVKFFYTTISNGLLTEAIFVVYY